MASVSFVLFLRRDDWFRKMRFLLGFPGTVVNSPALRAASLGTHGLDELGLIEEIVKLNAEIIRSKIGNVMGRRWLSDGFTLVYPRSAILVKSALAGSVNPAIRCM